MTQVLKAPPIADFNPEVDTFRADFVRGLSCGQKQISPKYLYDARGARLFDAICELDEYFPTRTEMRILEDNIDAIRDACGPACRVVELGSGSSLKTSLLLSEMTAPAAYIPVEISRECLKQASGRLAAEHPEIEVLPVCADYTESFTLPPGTQSHQRTIVFFPGSTIGNFTPPAAVQFLKMCRKLCGANGGLLIGAALQTDTAVLEAAYNDAKGVTAEFNLNLLHRAVRELGAEIDVDGFEHQAVYDAEHGRIEMRLCSTRDQAIRLGSNVFSFKRGEYLLTEYSHKFTVEGFAEMAASAGFRRADVWVDDLQRFSVHLLVP